MAEIIDTLRKFDGNSNTEFNDHAQEIMEILDAYPVVEETFEDGGRWSNFRTEVFKVEDGDEVAHFKFMREVPATEMQDGQECYWTFDEVTPVEVTVTKYV